MSINERIAAAHARHGRIFRCDQLVERKTPRSPLLTRLDELSGKRLTARELAAHAHALKCAYIDSLGVGAMSLRAARGEVWL